MRPLTDALKTGMWAGRRAFVVGSGPSLHGFDFGWLKDELTIGCNEEYKWGPTIALVQDVRAFKGDGSRKGYRDMPEWYARPGTLPVYFKAHPDRENLEAPDEVFEAKSCHTRERPFGWGETIEGGLTYGGNCGLAALSLACALHADPIYLLGLDFRCGPVGETHHHDGYPEHWRLAMKELHEVFARDIKEFEGHAHNVKGQVFNLNPESALECFPKVSTVAVTRNRRRMVVSVEVGQWSAKEWGLV